MSYTGELKYPSYFSYNETPNILKFNTLVEAVRYLTAATKQHLHTGSAFISNGSIDGMQIGTASIADLCITTALICDGSILYNILYNTTPNQAVSTATIRDQAVTNGKIETSINSSTGLDGSTKILDNTLTPIKLYNGVATPNNQTYYGKDVSGVLGFETLSIYATTLIVNGTTLQLKNNATVLSTVTPNYSTDADTLNSQHVTYYTCVSSCSWCCVGDCTAACVSTCVGTCQGVCTSACVSSCSTNCSGGCAGGCKNSCSGGCDGSCYTACEDWCDGGCTLSCRGGYA